MTNLILLAKMVACLMVSIALGNWFLTKARAANARGDAWYKAYISLPGLIVLASLLGLPLLLWLTGK
ncbi:MAG: hypothetical protein AB1724_13080 [Thermodesulfobacteriota bacterium]